MLLSLYNHPTNQHATLHPPLPSRLHPPTSTPYLLLFSSLRSRLHLLFPQSLLEVCAARQCASECFGLLCVVVSTEPVEAEAGYGGEEGQDVGDGGVLGGGAGVVGARGETEERRRGRGEDTTRLQATNYTQVEKQSRDKAEWSVAE